MFIDGEILVYQTWSDGLRPDPDVTVSEWAEKYRVVSADSGSPRPGRWDHKLAPYGREVMDLLSPSHPCRKVVAKKAAQLAFSEFGVNLFGTVAHLAPAPMVYMLPTDGEVQKYNTLKLDPTIKDTPELRSRVAEQRSRTEKGSTARFKKFTGGYLQLVPASTSSALQMISARYLIYEECSEYTEDAGGRGHPIDQARTRSDAWSEERKEYFCSTPKNKGTCRITSEYETCTVQLRLYVRCPHCGWYTTFGFDRLHHEEHKPYHAWVECAHGGCRIEHIHKKAAYADFAYAWVPTWDDDGVIFDDALSPDEIVNARFDPWSPKGLAAESVGVAASQLYSPFKSFDDVADQIVGAKIDPKKAKAVCQQVKGEAYDEGGSAPPWDELESRREDYEPGTLPYGAFYITAGADVQGDRIEVEVVGFGRGLSQWSIDYRVFEGDTQQAQVWNDLDDWFRETSFPDAWGNLWRIDMLAIDNGYRTRFVNAWAARHPNRAMVIKGDGAPKAPAVRKGSKVTVTVSGRKTGIYQWLAGTHQLKLDFYDQLSLTRNDDGSYGPGFCHWPKSYTTRPCEAAHLRQVVSEHLVENKNGTREWVLPSGVRNEPLDTRVYATAAAYRQGLPYFNREAWDALARERGFDGDLPESTDNKGQPDLFAANKTANAVRGGDGSNPSAAAALAALINGGATMGNVEV